jgi:hypothetical protein
MRKTPDNKLIEIQKSRTGDSLTESQVTSSRNVVINNAPKLFVSQANSQTQQATNQGRMTGQSNQNNSNSSRRT